MRTLASQCHAIGGAALVHAFDVSDYHNASSRSAPTVVMWGIPVERNFLRAGAEASQPLEEGSDRDIAPVVNSKTSPSGNQDRPGTPIS